jgi:hypothetical protein
MRQCESDAARPAAWSPPRCGWEAGGVMSEVPQAGLAAIIRRPESNVLRLLQERLIKAQKATAGAPVHLL